MHSIVCARQFLMGAACWAYRYSDVPQELREQILKSILGVGSVGQTDTSDTWIDIHLLTRLLYVVQGVNDEQNHTSQNQNL